MPIINSIISWAIKKRIHQIEFFRKYPLGVQNELFTNLINEAKHTEWGKKYNYHKIKTIQEFKNGVPISDYNKLKPYINRIREGEKDVLWPGKVKWFAKSSGTTEDKSKFIPITDDALEECHMKGGRDMLSIFTNNYPETQIYDGKGLVLGGSQQLDNFDNDTYHGDLSSIIISNFPFWGEMLRTPDISIALMSNWEEKIEKMAEATIKENVTNLSGVPSWMLVLLNKVLEKTKAENILEVWPNLELYIHGAVNFTPYKNQFAELIPGNQMSYLECYNATEGFFGIQDQKNSDEMLLMLDYGIYYEFLPIENIDDEHPETLSLKEVEIDKNYGLIISTNAGLWRYMIGDTVKFTSIHPFRIKITGRTKSFINAFGEELIIDNAEKALEVACSKTNAAITEYTAAPIYLQNNKSGGHEWIIEFKKQPDSIEAFGEILDNTLKAVNSDYEAKRIGNIALHPPKIVIAPIGTFYNWLKQKGKLGGQNKVPRLCNNRDVIESVLKML